MAYPKHWIRPSLCYFPGYSLGTTFGHVSLNDIAQAYTREMKEKSEISSDESLKVLDYLAYGANNLGDRGQAASHIYEMARINLAFESQPDVYGPFVEIILPPMDPEKIRQAAEKFKFRNPNDYSFVRNNCADAVMQFMKEAGYIPQKEYTFINRPSRVGARICKVGLDHAKAERKMILATPTVNQFKALLDNDLERLYYQNKLYQINNNFLIRVKYSVRFDVTTKGMHKEERLKQISSEYQKSNYEKSFELLCDASEKLDGNTGEHVRQLMNDFPYEKLSDVNAKWEFILKLKKDLDQFKDARSGLFKLPPTGMTELRRKLDKISPNKKLPDKDIHQLFYLAKIKLNQKSNEKKKFRSQKVDDFYQAYSLEANELLKKQSKKLR